MTWILGCVVFLALWGSSTQAYAQEVQILAEGLNAPAEVFRDPDGYPHIFAETERDAFYLLGYLHAEDRYFQIDFYRHLFEGRLTELLGPGGLSSDIQFRQFDLVPSTEASYRLLSNRSQRILNSYARGMNEWIAQNQPSNEYGVLERAQLRPWRPEDSLLILRGFSLSSFLSLRDLTLTQHLAAYQAAGSDQGFDGDALFLEDLYRAAPIEAVATTYTAIKGSGIDRRSLIDEGPDSVVAEGSRAAPRALSTVPVRAEIAELARQAEQRMQALPALAKAFDPAQGGIGSNWWLLSGEHTTTGTPFLANDPHQALSMPPVLYEVHIRIDGPRQQLELQGINFAGLPAIVIGCNQDLCWGATNNNFDWTDIYAEELVVDPATGQPTHTVFRGQQEPLVVKEQSYLSNVVGDGEPDSFETLAVDAAAGGLTYHLPRRAGGPLISIGPATDGVASGLSLQYAGFAAGKDFDSFAQMHRARNIGQFRNALRFADIYSFNFAFADRRGNIGYEVSGEHPLREDLQNLGRVDGAAPFLVRDGTGAAQNEWIPATRRGFDHALPWEVLPRSEMPSAFNPRSGILVSSNNDPVGATLDNDPFDQFRDGGGVLYLNREYVSLRASKVERLLRQDLAERPEGISIELLEEQQANTEMLDAELVTPFLFRAFRRASRDGAPEVLAAYAADERIVEAVERLAEWDFSTPTGLLEGYDPGDDPDDLRAPSEEEVRHSVAATLYSVWRGQLVRRVVDETLVGLGLESAAPDSRSAFKATVHRLRNFPRDRGIGASGVNFFAVDGVSDPRIARDVVLLESLSRTLDLLAGEAFESAFARSRDFDDYRWGKLHRITLAHLLGAGLGVPAVGPFGDLAPDLPGLARAGGFESIDVAGHDLRAADAQSFTFSVAPGRRAYVSLESDAIQTFQILPGGAEGDPFLSGGYVSQIGRWLTNRYAPVTLDPLVLSRTASETLNFEPVTP
ncbi:MAG: penicillin acylase family protein [Acidobacteriota bacterium]